MTRTKLFVDHDGTLTYFDVKLGKWKYKDGTKEFLRFIVEKFDCCWCSGLDHIEILRSVRKTGIEEDVLNKIEYFDYSLPGEKARSIVEETRDFLFIDDDGYGEEYKYLKKKGMEDRFIKADYKESRDLVKIMKILNSRLG